MNKLAVFVEGYTEQIFVEKLLIEIAGRNNVCIEKSDLFGGNRGKRKGLHFSHSDNGTKYFAYIINCHGDSTVPSDIRDNYENLVRAGYSSILGIRDVYPIKRVDIPKLRQGLGYGIKTKPIAPVFILSVMEIEAWFLAEHSHFQRIHKSLTIDRIRTDLGFDPSQEDMELRDHPAQDLHQVYALAGMVYKKRKSHINRTVQVIDYAQIYLSLNSSLRPIEELTSEIDRFIGAALTI